MQNLFDLEKENINSRKIEKQKQILNTYENFKKYQDDLKQTFKAKPAGGKIEIAIDFSNIPFEDNIHYLRGRNAEMIGLLANLMKVVIL